MLYSMLLKCEILQNILSWNGLVWNYQMGVSHMFMFIRGNVPDVGDNVYMQEHGFNIF